MPLLLCFWWLLHDGHPLTSKSYWRNDKDIDVWDLNYVFVFMFFFVIHGWYYLQEVSNWLINKRVSVLLSHVQWLGDSVKPHSSYPRSVINTGTSKITLSIYSQPTALIGQELWIYKMTQILQRRLIPTGNFRMPCDNLKKKGRHFEYDIFKLILLNKKTCYFYSNFTVIFI